MFKLQFVLMILKHKCLECGFVGEVEAAGRKVICPQCKTKNDFWLLDELPPIHHRDQKPI